MKKNRMMRLASGLLVAVLLTTSVISGTFAKYTTSASSQDSARVANWGFDNAATIQINNLFQTSYDKNVNGVVDVIAPGTTNSASFQFTYNEQNEYAPEVAYTFSVLVTDSTCDIDIANNKNIQWRLNSNDVEGTWGDWGTLLESIKALSGDADGIKEDTAGQLPDAFKAEDIVHEIEWQWLFEGNETYQVDINNDGIIDSVTQDQYDTWLGNKITLDDCLIKITIIATQLD